MMLRPMNDVATVVAVMAQAKHGFSKTDVPAIRLIEGFGVAGDAHAGATDQHLYHMRRDPLRVNLRQVHLIHAELFAMLAERGLHVAPGDLGENVTTRGIDLLNLAEDTRLDIGDAELRITGLRVPCFKIEKFQPGLLRALIVDKKAQQFLSGVMAVVTRTGNVRPGDAIVVRAPAGAPRRLVPV